MFVARISGFTADSSSHVENQIREPDAMWLCDMTKSLCLPFGAFVCVNPARSHAGKNN